METTLFAAGGAARHAASRPRPRRASEELQAYRALARSRRAPAPQSFSAKSDKMGRFCGTVGSRPAGRVRRGPRPAATTRKPLRDDTWSAMEIHV